MTTQTKDNSIPVVISLGAGVQSSAMAIMAAKGELTPMPKAAIFADTQAEPASVYRWLDWLEKQLPFPVIRTTKGSLENDACIVKRSGKSGKLYMKGLIPAFVKDGDRIGLLGRKCTADYKIRIIHQAVRLLLPINVRKKAVQARIWIGISTDEASRMKPSKVKWMESEWPLIDKMMSRGDCIKWMKQNDFPEPPRSACVFCPFHSDAEWLRLKEDEPEEFNRAVRFEQSLQAAARSQDALKGVPFLTKRCVSLDQIKFSDNARTHQQINMFNNECEGMCGV